VHLKNTKQCRKIS